VHGSVWQKRFNLLSHHRRWQAIIDFLKVYIIAQNPVNKWIIGERPSVQSIPDSLQESFVVGGALRRLACMKTNQRFELFSSASKK